MCQKRKEESFCTEKNHYFYEKRCYGVLKVVCHYREETVQKSDISAKSISDTINFFLAFSFVSVTQEDQESSEMFAKCYLMEEPSREYKRKSQ